MIYSTGQFLHKGKIYKIKCVINNLLTFEQSLTLSIGADVVDTKVYALFGKRTLKEMGGVMLCGVIASALMVGLLKVMGV